MRSIYFRSPLRVLCQRRHSSGVSSLSIEQDIVKALQDLVEPVTSRTFGSIGLVQSVRVTNAKAVEVNLDLFVPGYTHQSKISDMCKSTIARLHPSIDARIQVSKPAKFGSIATLESSSLSRVGHVIGVSSCKGGVGKSTVAVNLALSLAAKGLKVGILDADVYGPSLPHLLPAMDLTVKRSQTNPKHVLPLDSTGGEVKMLSFGHVNPKSGAPGSGGKSAAVVRGPIVSKIINQLLLSTEWGDLDYLLVDMPPGTGDIQITLTQSVSLTGAVIVTTPHTLSLVDAAKGVAMFEELKVPTLSVVENMAYFTCEHGSKYFPFGRGGRQRLLQGLADSVSSDEVRTRLDQVPIQSIPLVPEPESDVSGDGSNSSSGSNGSSSMVDHKCGSGCSHDHSAQSSDGGSVVLPIVLREPQSESAQVYSKLADDVINEIYRSQADVILTPTVSYAEKKRVLQLRYFTATQAQEFSIPVEQLRIRDPQTGLVIPGSKPASAFSGASVTKLDVKGKYGVALVWSDGHYADIFPFTVLRRIAEELAK